MGVVFLGRPSFASAPAASLVAGFFDVTRAVQVESSASSIREGKGEALPGGQRAATLQQDKASIPNTTHYERSMVRRICQRVQS